MKTIFFLKIDCRLNFTNANVANLQVDSSGSGVKNTGLLILYGDQSGDEHLCCRRQLCERIFRKFSQREFYLVVYYRPHYMGELMTHDGGIISEKPQWRRLSRLSFRHTDVSMIGSWLGRSY